MSALVQTMACCLHGAKPLSEPVLDNYQLNPQEQYSVKFNENTNFFYSRKAFDNIICEMATIVSRVWGGGDEFIATIIFTIVSYYNSNILEIMLPRTNHQVPDWAGVPGNGSSQPLECHLNVYNMIGLKTIEFNYVH